MASGDQPNQLHGDNVYYAESRSTDCSVQRVGERGLLQQISPEDRQTLITLYQTCPFLWDAFRHLVDFIDVLSADPWSSAELLYRHLKIINDRCCSSSPTEVQHLSRFAVAIGFVDKAVELMRKMTRGLGMDYVADLSLPLGTDEMSCVYLVRDLFVQMSCHENGIRLRLARTGFLQDVLADLRHLHHLTTEELWKGEVFFQSIATVQNLCKSPDVLPLVREARSADVIIPYLEREDTKTKAAVLLTLCYILEDPSSDLFHLDVGTLQMFLEKLQYKVTHGRDQRGCLFTLDESLFALSRLACNNFNKRLMVLSGTTKYLVWVLAKDVEEDSLLAVTTVAELAADPLNAKFFRRFKELVQVLRALQRSEHHQIRGKANTALQRIDSQSEDGSREEEEESPLLTELMADSSNALAILGVTEVEFLLDELSVTASTVQRLRADFCPEHVLRVLADLARGDNRKLEILARGGLEVLRQHLQQGTAGVKLQAVEVLLQLATNTENCAILQSHIGLSETVKELRHSDNLAVSRAAERVDEAILDATKEKASLVFFNQ